jgi:hypothetical protein
MWFETPFFPKVGDEMSLNFTFIFAVIVTNVVQ